MGKSLAEYAATHREEQPAAEREAMAALAADAKERAAAIERAAELKDSIAQQLEQGNEPQYILYTALKCIGLLSNDTEWTEAQHGQLDKIYKDIAQQSLLDDNAAIAAKRLEQTTSRYNERMRAQLNKQLAGYGRIAAGLREALAALDGIDPQEQTETE